ncbi:lipocalin family protein [Robertkochia flava]|uniref:lipocalin family protein n=1 Tax=Robertkochia flava TaxID=3447986 RepID=UPI001CCC7B50|nr:lipocalin family protein [Robertkochia marina]
MKKSVNAIFALFISVLLISCGGSSSLGKENKSLRSNLDGTWELKGVTYDGEGYYKSTLFDDANAKCYEGSEWFFRSNNSTGTYTLSGDECNPGIRYIRWSIQNDANGNPSTFTFKFTDEKKNDLYGGAGYVFNIQSISESSMVLSSTESAGDGNVDLVYEFNKIMQ